MSFLGHTCREWGKFGVTSCSLVQLRLNKGGSAFLLWPRPSGQSMGTGGAAGTGQEAAALGLLGQSSNPNPGACHCQTRDWPLTGPCLRQDSEPCVLFRKVNRKDSQVQKTNGRLPDGRGLVGG